MLKIKFAIKIIDKIIFFDLQDRDVAEGADMLMVKPGMAYLDVVRDVKNRVTKLFNRDRSFITNIFKTAVIIITIGNNKKY